MFGKSQIATTLETMIVGSVTAIGFAVASPVASAALLGIGLNLASNLVQKGFTQLKEDWVLGKNGILNHDIQFAFVRAFTEAVSKLEAEYFALESSGNLFAHQRERTKYLFRELKSQAQAIFVESKETFLSNEDLKVFLEEDESVAKFIFWEKIENQLITCDTALQNLFRDTLLDQVMFYFGEELKKDDKENNKAWRAFQRLLLEGIKKDIREVKADVKLIQADLQKLDGIASQVSQLHQFLQRNILEPFAADLQTIKTDVQVIRSLVEKPRYLAEETVRQKVSELHGKLFMANSRYELSSLLNQVNYLLDQHPNYPETVDLKDKIELAIRRERRMKAPKTKIKANYAPNSFLRGSSGVSLMNSSLSLLLFLVSGILLFIFAGYSSVLFIIWAVIFGIILLLTLIGIIIDRFF
jgi:hypothetical protein